MRVYRKEPSSHSNTVTFDQSVSYGRRKLKPVRQVPSGAKRASGMLMRPAWPETLGSCADAHAAAQSSSTNKKGPVRGLSQNTAPFSSMVRGGGGLARCVLVLVGRRGGDSRDDGADHHH